MEYEAQPTSYPDAMSWESSVTGLPMEMELIAICRSPASTSRGSWSRIAIANSGVYLPYTRVCLARERGRK